MNPDRNNRGECIPRQMQEWCCSQGIKQNIGILHTPKLNSIAERYNRTSLDRLKPSLNHSSLHHKYWSDALNYAVWTTNERFKTPYEVYEGKLLSMRHAHIFGAKRVYLVPFADRKKMDNHPSECYFLGVLPLGDRAKVLDK